MNKKIEQNLQQINRVLEKAFFAPLQVNDWLGFNFNQPFLLGAGQDELMDLFARCALACQRLQPEQEHPPLLRLLRTQNQAQVLAHALVSLKDDRPFLFHRSLASLAHLVQENLDPDDYASMEEMLEEVLQNQLELAAGAEQEIKSLHKQAMALIDPTPVSSVKKYLKQILESPQLVDIQNENQLRLWLSAGSGRDQVPQELLPQLLIEAWAAWCGAITGARPNPELLLRCQPGLNLSADQLECYLPPQPEEDHTLFATCPFCQGGNVIKVNDDKIEAIHRCPHLVFIGTNDPMHLLRVLLLTPASIGEDTLQLLDSYYQSLDDLPLFANIITDFYQMLVNQNRVKESIVTTQPDDQAFAHLHAYFYQEPPSQKGQA